MATYSVSASALTEGSTVLVRGKLGYARLASLIEGQDLIASDQRRAQNGMSPVGKPHTTATITHASVVYADPNNPTTEEKFVAERHYASKKNPDTGANYSIDSKGSNLPVIAIPSPKGDGTFDQDTSGRELAQGSDVTLVLRVYKPKNYNNRGLSLDQVIVNDPTPRYYNDGGTVAQDELAARGIVFNAPPRPIPAQNAPAAAAAPGSASNTVGTQMEDGLAFPAPSTDTAGQEGWYQGGQPVAEQPMAFAQAPVAQAPVAQAPVAQPQMAQAPVAQAPVAQVPAETPEQKLARLEAENAALRGAGSAVGAPTTAGPWDGNSGQQPGITYQS